MGDDSTGCRVVGLGVQDQIYMSEKLTYLK